MKTEHTTVKKKCDNCSIIFSSSTWKNTLNQRFCSVRCSANKQWQEYKDKRVHNSHKEFSKNYKLAVEIYWKNYKGTGIEELSKIYGLDIKQVNNLIEKFHAELHENINV